MSLEKYKKWIVLALIFILLYYACGKLPLEMVPGPERVDASLYSVVANAPTLTQSGVHSIIGQVQPKTWIAYKDSDLFGVQVRSGYRWVRPDAKTPVIEAVMVDRNSGGVLCGVTLEVRFKPVTMEDVNAHGDPIGRNPTQIDWYSYEMQKTESGNKVTWKHYEVWVVPVDVVVELSVRPVLDLNVGDFQNVDLWFVLDTTVWMNAFTRDQYALLKQNPPQNVTITGYNYRGGFPIWAWVGAWEPWQVRGRDGNPDKFYDPADLSAEERSELEMHLRIWPSYAGSEVSLYTSPSYKYERLFTADIVKNPDKLKGMLASQIPGLPDPRFAQTVYLPITLINYGALKREGGFWPWEKWHKEYYPTSYLRIRCLYAIYGEWVYMWTKQEAEKFNYQWENRSSIITGEKSWWDKFMGGISAWFSNPFNQLWMFFIPIVIVIIVVSVFSPGIWTALALRRRKE